MTREELARFDGRDGKKALVAVNGKIYDFSASPLWQGGRHQDQHQAGADLTEELTHAPHIRAVVERYPVVDHLEETSQPQKKSALPWIAAALVLAIVLLAAWLLL